MGKFFPGAGGGTGRGGAPHRYLRAAAPLLYGGAVAWMFLGDDFLLALRIILFGAVLPVAGLLWLWRSDRDWDPPEERDQHRQ